ncbi:ion channel [Aquimarina hainanensis]|uniref:Ion channel n=1 Tax=Aquimarina hainanensis TaxID=1578017 RepID=A0ABW5NED7_9FLAO|nr:potassium channel family protein [Aquimarina sp. TRL1]QKX06725.1 hypothetical protein HN014_17980 [Aquimarina sp. TRL1]
MWEKLYKYRFENFFFSQIAILFGSLVVPAVFFELVLSPILFLINLSAGIILISKRKKTMWFFLILLIVTGLVFGFNMIKNQNSQTINFVRLGAYFLFYIVVTIEMIKQVWNAAVISKNVILGLISGYISLGLIGFFICLSIEMVIPGSFNDNIAGEIATKTLTEKMMYYSYITLLTIGYGDIVPLTELARKAAILIGLMGQMYLVVITAIVMGKYVNQISK